MYGNDFSAGAIPVGIKFYTAVSPHLRQVSPILGDSPRDGQIMGVNVRGGRFSEL